MHEVPLVVFRDAETGHSAVMPLTELLALQRVARAAVHARLSGDAMAARALATVADVVQRPLGRDRCRAVIAGYLLRAAIEDAYEHARISTESAATTSPPAPPPAPRPAAAPDPAPAAQVPAEEVPVTFCQHGRPSDIACPDCPSSKEIPV